MFKSLRRFFTSEPKTKQPPAATSKASVDSEQDLSKNAGSKYADAKADISATKATPKAKPYAQEEKENDSSANNNMQQQAAN
eukprot:scaffold234309_cov24-Prasinocladus_malaysianus.AAC.1